MPRFNFKIFFVVGIFIAIIALILVKFNDRQTVAHDFSDVYVELCKTGLYKYNEYQPTPSECRKLASYESSMYEIKINRSGCYEGCKSLIIKDKCQESLQRLEIAEWKIAKLMGWEAIVEKALGSDCIINTDDLKNPFN
jgi:hypothetical protein